MAFNALVRYYWILVLGYLVYEVYIFYGRVLFRVVGAVTSCTRTKRKAILALSRSLSYPCTASWVLDDHSLFLLLTNNPTPSPSTVWYGMIWYGLVQSLCECDVGPRRDI